MVSVAARPGHQWNATTKSTRPKDLYQFAIAASEMTYYNPKDGVSKEQARRIGDSRRGVTQADGGRLHRSARTQK